MSPSKLLLPDAKVLWTPAGTVAHVSRFPEAELVKLRGLGIFPTVAGGAKGTNTLGDVLTQTADGRDLNEIWAEYQRTLQFWNDSRTALVSALTFAVTNPIEDVPQLTTDDFEEASEFGVPKGIRGADYFSMGYDFRWYDLAVRYTWQFLAEASAGQVDALHNTALEADNRLIFTKVLKAIFNNVNRTATIRQTAVNVYPFYNADGTVPPQWKNTTHSGSHTHYLISGAGTVDSGDLTAMEDHLRHHGYGPDSGSTLILLCNRQEASKIRGFRVLAGDAYDFVPAPGGPPALLTGSVVGATPPTAVNGLPVIGQYGPWLIVEDDWIQAGYLFGFATGGVNAARNPVGLREHQNASLRGLRLIRGDQGGYPLIDSYYNRGFGTGVRHRGAGIVMQIAASGSYTIPTAFQ